MELFIKLQKGWKPIWDGVILDPDLEDNALDKVEYVFLSYWNSF